MIFYLNSTNKPSIILWHILYLDPSFKKNNDLHSIKGVSILFGFHSLKHSPGISVFLLYHRPVFPALLTISTNT